MKRYLLAAIFTSAIFAPGCGYDSGSAPSSVGSGSGGSSAQPTLAVGRSHTCATRSGVVTCWGLGSDGRLGYANANTIGDNELPSTAGNMSLGGSVTKVASGNFSSHNCALVSGSVYCWGEYNSGSLGYGNTNVIGDNETPASAGPVSLGSTAIDISTGYFSSCAILTGGTVNCWGYNNVGQLGRSNMTDIGDNETPQSVGTLNLGGATAKSVYSGGGRSCIITNTDNVMCWGDGSNGMLGYGNTNTIGDNETPGSAGNVNLGGATITQLAMGNAHTCALTSSGTVYCWGDGGNGNLGYNGTADIGDNETPVSAGTVNVGGTVTKIAAGVEHSCALLTTGAVRCWGRNQNGQLGYGNTNNIGDNELPSSAGDVSVGGTVIDLFAGDHNTCVVLSDNSVKCWGLNDMGQIGQGNTTNIGDDELPSTIGAISF